MRHDEAQAEADRRNREDPDRERFEFYPFDESAGMADDAWDVAARLRQGPSTARPATAAGARRREAAPAVPVHEEPETAHEEAKPVYAEPVYAEPVYAEPVHSELVYEEPVHAEPLYEEPVYADPEPVYDDEDEDWEDDRPGFFVRLVGAVVVVVGLAWLALVVTLALVLKPDDATSFAIYLGAAALGLLAMALGVAIRRS